MPAEPVPLRQSNLSRLPTNVRVPTYPRFRSAQDILHIGVGGFHRAHQAVYLDDLLHLEPGWRLVGVGVLPQDARMRDILREQDFLYTVVERDASGDSARIIGSIEEFCLGPEDREQVLERLAAENTKIISLTITEGGYFVNQGTGAFDEANPDIQYDLSHPGEPRTTFGYLAEALARRRQAGRGPCTLLSCDNLQSNGEVLRKMLLSFCELRDPGLRNWLEQNGTFPNCMVDRITPATTEAHRALLAEEFSIADGWPVMPETFRQWVIEDHFVQGRPAWEKVGVQITGDVLPYEKMKLRLLNASHQAICYVGLLLGYESADQAMADPQIPVLMRRMMDEEVTPILPPVPGIDLTAYKASLVERFANPAVKDQLVRIATEGSARIPKFVLPSILDELEVNGPIRLLTFTVASWIQFLRGVDDLGKPLTIIEPLADLVRPQAALEDPTALIQVNSLFGDVLPRAERFVGLIKEFSQVLRTRGAREALTLALGG
jgi:mannitol 2-dehydrogenase